MKFWVCLMMGISLFGASAKKSAAEKPAKTTADVVCVDIPRVMARKNPVKKLELSEAMSRDLSGVLFGVSLTDQMELRVDMESPSEDGATQLEKMVGLLVSAQRLKSEPGEPVGIDLQRASRIARNGKVVRTTVSLTDQQLEKILEARYGRKLIAEAKARMVYVHGLYGGTKSYPWGDGLTIDLRQ